MPTQTDKDTAKEELYQGQRVRFLLPKDTQSKTQENVLPAAADIEQPNVVQQAAPLVPVNVNIEDQPPIDVPRWKAGEAIWNSPTPAMTLADLALSEQLDRFPDPDILKNASREDVLRALHRLLKAANAAIAATNDPDTINGREALEAAKVFPYRRKGEDFELWWARQSEKTLGNAGFVTALLDVQHFLLCCTSIEGGTRIVVKRPPTMTPIEECIIM